MNFIHTGVGRVLVVKDGQLPSVVPLRDGHGGVRTDYAHGLTLRQYLDRRRATRYGPTNIGDLHLDNCRWPLWADGADPTLQFCGARTIPEKSYCEHHYCIAHGKKAA